MKAVALFGVVATGLLGACATTGTPEQISCYQPNRRVTVEIVGTKVKCGDFVLLVIAHRENDDRRLAPFAQAL